MNSVQVATVIDTLSHPGIFRQIQDFKLNSGCLTEEEIEMVMSGDCGMDGGIGKMKAAFERGKKAVSEIKIGDGGGGDSGDDSDDDSDSDKEGKETCDEGEKEENEELEAFLRENKMKAGKRMKKGGAEVKAGELPGADSEENGGGGDDVKLPLAFTKKKERKKAPAKPQERKVSTERKVSSKKKRKRVKIKD